MSTNVKTVIENVLKEVAETHDIQLSNVKGNLELVDDLGFTSLMVAAIIANLEEELDVDPFEDEDVMITDIVTVDDLIKVYQASVSA